MRGAQKAGTYAALLTAVNEIIRSPLFRTTKAIFKNELAKAIATENAAEITRLAARMGAGAAGVKRTDDKE